jgi:phage terminase small subunit
MSDPAPHPNQATRSPTSGHKPKKLTDKQQRFCEEYVKDFNGLRAYQRAGYKIDSLTTANAESSKLLKKAHIQSYLTKLRSDLRMSDLIEIKRIIQELQIVGYSDITQFVKLEEGDLKLRDFSELPENITRAISKISCSTDKGRKTLRIELHDKLAALDKLGLYNGMFSDLNQAIAIFRKYDFEVLKTDEGYQIIDKRTDLPPSEEHESDELN